MQSIPVHPTEHIVRDMMSTPVHSIDMDDSVLNVKRLFERERCHHVMVMNRSQVLGVVSDRDILKAASPFVGSKTMERSQDLNSLKRRVHQIMSRDLITITPDETVSAAAEKMIQEHVSCLPVLEKGGSVVGIVTVRDFVKWSAGVAGTDMGRPDERERNESILIIIDGNRCYLPDASMARLIREAEELYDANQGVGAARAKHLTMPSKAIV